MSEPRSAPDSAPLAIFVIVGVVSYQAVMQQTETRIGSHTHEVQNELTQLSDLKDAETGQRGYLITGMDPIWPPTRRARRRQKAIASVSRSRQRQSQTGGPADALESLIADKLAELQETIEVRKTRDFRVRSKHCAVRSRQEVHGQHPSDDPRNDL